MGDPKPALVERGEGYWCFRVMEQNDMPLVAEPSAAVPDEPATYDEREVYLPVQVDVNSDGDAYAWFWHDYDDPMKAAEMEGKRYVPMDQVYLNPLPDFVDIRRTDAEIP